MSVSFQSTRKKRGFWADDNDLPSLNCKKTRSLPPPHGFHLQGCSENKFGLLVALHDHFPMLDEKTIATVLERYGDNLAAAIEQLEQLQLAPQSQPSDAGSSLPNNPPQESSEGLIEKRIASHWVDTILQELFKSESPEDSRRRLEALLKAFEEAAVENYKTNSEEMQAAKKQFEVMRKNNAILCKALTHKQERFKAQDTELAKLRAVLLQAEDRIKALELSNYTLSMHLERAVGPKTNDHGAPPDIF